MHCMHHTYIFNLFDSLEKMKTIIRKYVNLFVNNFNKWFLDLPISMLQNCSILNMILITRLNFSDFFSFDLLKSNCKTIIIHAFLCLNLRIYGTTFHGLEDPKVTNKLPSLIDECVCLQKCISKFNDALSKVKLLLWWA